MKKKISAVLAASMIASNISPAINVYANEVVKEKARIIEENAVSQAKIRSFNLSNHSNFEQYNAKFRVPKERIQKISNNGWQYDSSSIDKAIDGDLLTHWETGTPNRKDFKNEVVIEFKDVESINRIGYATRQDSARGKGYPTKFEIYSSITGEDKDFKLVCTGEHSQTGNMMEFKFDTITTKKVKFVFKEAHDDWASASEFWFYKEDKILDTMESLFKDSNKNEVSDEFKSEEKLKELENSVKGHPYSEDFKEDINDAKYILEDDRPQYVDAKVSKFKIVGAEKLANYDKAYKIDNKHITNITTNGSHWSDKTIDKAIDGDFNTYWHSDATNNERHTNEVIMTLDELQTLDKVVYTSLRDRGFAKEFEIYTSKTLSGNTFTKVTSGRSSITSDSISIKFNPTEARRIKFVFKDGHEGWALASEFGLYKEDKVSDKVQSIFTNGLMNELNPDYNTLDKIQALEKEVKGHPLEKELMETINKAKDIAKSPQKYQSNVYELESRGDSIKESQKRKVWNFQDWQPTGLAVKSGEKINVYVDAQIGTPLPKLVFKQMDSQHSGQITINLYRGKNEIIIPDVNSNDLRPGTAKAGILYTSNPYTAKQQIRKPKIRIDGGVSYPHFIKGVDNDEQVMKELREYNEKLKADPQLPDVFEVFSDKTLVNVKASYALNWYTKNNKLPSYTANKSDEVIKETMRYYGFDDSKDVHSDFNFRYVSMIKWLDNSGFMNAANGITGFNKAEQGGALDADTGWGFMHEMGHNFDTDNRTIAEVTNNMLPLHFQRIKGEPSKIWEQNLWERNILPKVSKANYSNNEWYPENDRSLLTHIAPMWQLQLYDDTFWPRLEQEFRERNIGGGSWDNIHEAWAVVASDVLQLDLKEYFARHGFYVSDATAKHMSQYKKPTKKLWYLNDNKYLNKGKGFNSELDYSVKPSLNGDSVKLDIKIDKTNANSLLGYEIIRDGEVIGFTSKDTFTDNNITSGTNHEYKVVAYDTQLNPSEGVIAKAHQPKIETVGGLTLKLNEQFNALDYVKATDYKGNKLNNITVSDNVDVTKQGKYTVTYEVNDKGTVYRDTMQVNVVSEYDYLSDIEWKSSSTEYGTPSRNNSIKGRTLGEVKDYAKGIRVHANGEVVYDLGEHNYNNFEVKVGVDMNMQAQENSSITFKVVGDGKTLATTKVLKHADNLQYINVPIKGVKELKIEVNDGGNGITADHGIMVEPKLIVNNAKPKLTIPKSQTVKVGEKLDNVVGTYKATDAEDGNLTEKVVVTGQDKVNFNRVGNYTITYSIIDKDGNKIEKSRVISVVDPMDFQYLSDIECKSATIGWGSIGKDTSVSQKKLRLTGEDGSVAVHDKGIGTHAHSEIVYDLKDKNVNMFSAFVGVDREMYNSPASIEFKVYVDGDLAYESGVMHSNDAQKFVEVDLSGAKELKLVATTGGDTDASDHANWADAKLYFVNNNRIYTTELSKAIEEANNINKDDYTEESVKILEDKLAEIEDLLKEETISQEAIDTATSELQESIKGLVSINLSKLMN